jgi:preprotein translocase subunit YajC
MRENVRVGDEVCTAGGIVGIVLRVNDDTVVLETGGERNKIRVKKWAIHENITQMEEQAAAEKERKAARRAGIATAAANDDKKMPVANNAEPTTTTHLRRRKSAANPPKGTAMA